MVLEGTRVWNIGEKLHWRYPVDAVARNPKFMAITSSCWWDTSVWTTWPCKGRITACTCIFQNHRLDHGNDELDMKYKLRDVTWEVINTFKVVNLNRLLCVWPLKKSVFFRNLWLKPLKFLLPGGEIRGMDLLRHHWRGVLLDLDHETTIFQTTNYCVASYYISISKHHQ